MYEYTYYTRPVNRYGKTVLKALAFNDLQTLNRERDETMKTEKPKKTKKFVPPAALWSGMALGVADALRAIITRTKDGDPVQRIELLEAAIRRQDRSVEDCKQMIVEYRQLLDRSRQTKRETEQELQALREEMNRPDQTMSDEEITELCDYLRNLHGVLGVMVTPDQSVKVLIRTAIRNDTGKLFDMGDFEFTLPSRGMSNIRPYWTQLADVMQITCVRLPRKEYVYQGEWYDYRLHHHYGRLYRRSDGCYAISGGQFCTGGRAADIVGFFGKRDFKQALSLLIATLNDTQHKNQLEEQGRFIPDQHEAAFYQTA